MKHLVGLTYMEECQQIPGLSRRREVRVELRSNCDDLGVIVVSSGTLGKDISWIDASGLTTSYGLSDLNDSICPSVRTLPMRGQSVLRYVRLAR